MKKITTMTACLLTGIALTACIEPAQTEPATINLVVPEEGWVSAEDHDGNVWTCYVTDPESYDFGDRVVLTIDDERVIGIRFED